MFYTFLAVKYNQNNNTGINSDVAIFHTETNIMQVIWFPNARGLMCRLRPAYQVVMGYYLRYIR